MKRFAIGWLMGALVLLGVQHLAVAQTQNTANTMKLDADAKSPPATLKDVAWLVGRWTGEGLGGQVEEVWTPPVHGQMMGMFRLVKEGKIVFYEFLTLAEHEGTIEMRIKHFNANMTGWEEKEKFLTFKLVKSEGDRVYLGGFTVERKGDDGWNGYLAMRGKDGALREEKFVFKRAPL
jgi:hypothetical protein